MKKLSRLDVIRLAVFSVLLIFAITSCSQKHSSIVEPIANAYGIESFGQIEAVRYTFNIDIPVLKLSRTWEWNPKTDTVTYEAKDKDGKPMKVTYQRSQLNGQSDLVKSQIDPGFVNDNYWFMLPFHVYWDSAANIRDQGSQQLKVGNGSADLVTVKYPSNVGYTPGDTWDLYVDNDHRISEMVYHRGGPKKPSLVIATWEGYKKAGPLLVSTEHRGTADGGPLHLFFSDVAVKLTGSDNWIAAQ